MIFGPSKLIMNLFLGHGIVPRTVVINNFVYVFNVTMVSETVLVISHDNIYGVVSV